MSMKVNKLYTLISLALEGNCSNTSDIVPLYLPQQLYLKPVARLNISLQLPNVKKMGKSVSHWEIMEKLRELLKPEEFTVLKVTKTTIEFVRFEAEVEVKSKLKYAVSKLDNRMIKLKDFNDLMRIRAAEWKSDFPNRAMWDDFFQNNKEMDEMRPGERPDTVHLSNLPSKWFMKHQALSDEDVIPSEKIFYRTMDAFRDMKLVHKGDDNAVELNIKVTFDKSKHLSDAKIRRREIVRDRLVKKAREKEEKEKAEYEEKKRMEHVEKEREEQVKLQKEQRRKLREEKRKAKILEKLEVSGTDEINAKIAKEEKKLLKVQRRLEAIRLVEELFKRIKTQCLITRKQ
ncbi:hypothetical protein NQ315_017317 [Exocentrus adspersus]|uniref:A-kinase anchor protein 17A n=1 Tax=Exocentrus adspersus TaxID=1586481 RepID=A0AAV8VDE2_9CUCU|nr:hypothetical protein NQ315_017317 [Exocentrus adspersus]